MKHIILPTLFASVFPLLAFAQSASTSSSTMGAGGSGMASGSSSISAQDKVFIRQAAYSGLAEVSDGSLAEKKGSATVQKIGFDMVTDHGKLNDQLAALSQQLNYPAPTVTDAKHLKMNAALSTISSGTFDTQYLKDETLGHKKTIALFKTEVKDGGNNQLKMLASAALPILESHLKMIEEAMDPVGTTVRKMGATST